MRGYPARERKGRPLEFEWTMPDRTIRPQKNKPLQVAQRIFYELPWAGISIVFLLLVLLFVLSRPSSELVATSKPIFSAQNSVTVAKSAFDELGGQSDDSETANSNPGLEDPVSTVGSKMEHLSDEVKNSLTEVSTKQFEGQNIHTSLNSTSSSVGDSITSNDELVTEGKERNTEVKTTASDGLPISNLSRTEKQHVVSDFYRGKQMTSESDDGLSVDAEHQKDFRLGSFAVSNSSSTVNITATDTEKFGGVSSTDIDSQGNVQQASKSQDDSKLSESEENSGSKSQRVYPGSKISGLGAEKKDKNPEFRSQTGLGGGMLRGKRNPALASRFEEQYGVNQSSIESSGLEDSSAPRLPSNSSDGLTEVEYVGVRNGTLFSRNQNNESDSGAVMGSMGEQPKEKGGKEAVSAPLGNSDELESLDDIWKKLIDPGKDGGVDSLSAGTTAEPWGKDVKTLDEVWEKHFDDKGGKNEQAMDLDHVWKKHFDGEKAEGAVKQESLSSGAETLSGEGVTDEDASEENYLSQRKRRRRQQIRGRELP